MGISTTFPSTGEVFGAFLLAINRLFGGRGNVRCSVDFFQVTYTANIKEAREKAAQELGFPGSGKVEELVESVSSVRAQLVFVAPFRGFFEGFPLQ